MKDLQDIKALLGIIAILSLFVMSILIYILDAIKDM